MSIVTHQRTIEIVTVVDGERRTVLQDQEVDIVRRTDGTARVMCVANIGNPRVLTATGRV